MSLTNLNMANFVTDSRNGLTISCAPQDQSHLHPTIRALVMEGDSVIFRGLPHPDIHREAPPAGLRIKDCLVYDSYEGALVNVFWHGGQWWFCTNKKLSIDRASWSASPGSFKRAFVNCLRKMWRDDRSWADLFDRSYMPSFCDANLDKDLGYVFMVFDPEERIVCSDTEQRLRLLATFDRCTNSHSYECSLTLTCGTEVEVPRPICLKNEREFLLHLRSQDPCRVAGVVLIDALDIHYKILPSEYTKVLDARGEQPRLLNRMFQLMEMGPEGEAHIEVLCRYFSDARVAMERAWDVRERIVQCYLDLTEPDSEPQVWMTRRLMEIVRGCRPGTERTMIDEFLRTMTTGQRKAFYKKHACLAGGDNAWISSDAPIEQAKTVQDLVEFPDDNCQDMDELFVVRA